MTPHTYRHAGHALALARAGRVTVDVAGPSCRGRAFRRERLVRIPPIRGVATYALALHELGHVLGPDQGGRRLPAEAGAWRWALDHTAERTPGFLRSARWRLLSYLAAAQVKAHRGNRTGLLIPEPDAPFWAVLAEVHTWPDGYVDGWRSCPWCACDLAPGDEPVHLAGHVADLVGPTGAEFWQQRRRSAGRLTA